MIQGRFHQPTKKRYVSIWEIKKLYIFIFFISNIPCGLCINAQYRWDCSKNYDSLRNDKTYSFCYKVESVYHPTQLYYEMTEKNEKENIVVFHNIDYNDIPICYGALQISIDGHDTIIFTDTLGIARIILPYNAQTIKISTFTRPKGFQITTTDRSVPSLIEIVWGSIEDGSSILMLYSKVPLKFKEFREISSSLFMGNHIESESFYYFFTNE